MNQQIELGNCVKTVKGFAFKSKWYTDKGRRIVKVSDFTEDSINVSNLVCIPEGIACQYSKHELFSGDIIIQTVGSWPSNPQSVVGKVIRVPKNAETSLLNQNAVKLIADDKIDYTYLFYLLKSIFFKEYIINTAQGAASQASITLESIKMFKFPLMCKDYQNKIASILSAYDDLIENNLKRIKILEEMAQMIYREWFVNFRFPGHEKVKMVDSPIGEVPEGWEVKKLGDVVTNIRKSTKAGEHLSNRHYVPIDIIPRKSLSLFESKSWEEAQSSLVLFSKGDILFGAMRSYFHKVVIAPFDGVTRTTCFILRPIKDIYYSYAVMRIFQDDTIAYSSKHSRGATIPYAVWDGALVNMKVCLPTDDLLDEFNNKLSPMLEAISSDI